MKTPLFSIALLCIAGFATKGQDGSQTNLATGPTNATSIVISVGPHSRTWSNPRGGNPINELATGMNVWNGQNYVPSNPSFQVSEDGTAFVANQVQHKIRLAADLNAIGSVSITTPDGIVLNTTPVGIGLYDAASGNSLIIGAITNCSGFLVSSNQVVYETCFAGVSASLVYTLEKGSFRQDVVVTENINPADYGFPTNTTRIQILTEFYNPPQPDEIVHPINVEKNQAVRNSMVSPDLVDQTLGFGELVLASGKAYTVGTTNVGASAPVAKEFTTTLGRTFLIESVEYRSLQRGLNALPRQTNQVVKYNATKSKIGYASIPKAGTLQKSAALNTSRQMTMAAVKRAGVVIDYNATIGGTLDSSYVFRGDTTYFVSGDVHCPGNVTIEGNAVFKYAPGVSIEIESSLTCQTASYRPAIFTAADDNSVGDTLSTNIWGSYTGTVQSGGYANPALLFDSLPGTLSQLRFSYAQQGVGVNFGCDCGMTIAHSQFINCIEGINLGSSSDVTITAYDCLFANNGNVVVDDYGGGPYSFCSCTIDNSSQPISNTGGYSLYATNSVFSNIGDWVYLNLAGNCNGFYNTAQFGDNQYSSGYPFQSKGAGNYYLTNGSPFRGVGTTVFDSSLQAKTTYPPVVYSNITILTNLTLLPQAPRDGNNSPDLGYHYDPIDYLVDRFAITNATLTVTNGVAIACCNTSGIVLKAGALITMTGTPLDPDWLARYSSVQEQPLLLGSSSPSFGVSVSPNPSGGLGVNGQFRFTRFSCPAGGGYHLYDSGSQSYSNLYVRDCELSSGTNYLSGPTNSATAFLKNNLFQRSPIFASNSTPQFSLTLSNNLVWGAYVTINQPSNGVWYAFDNDFDSCLITNSILTNDYNAYITCINRLLPIGAHDIVLTNNLAYQAGPLGNYYQRTNSPLINVGSTTADVSGLYHYTVTTNLVSGLEVKETNSIVDIGYHYVAVSSNSIPIDTNGDGIPDYLEDANGNGLVDIGEFTWAWNVADGQTLKVLITRPRNGSILP